MYTIFYKILCVNIKNNIKINSKQLQHLALTMSVIKYYGAYLFFPFLLTINEHTNSIK